MIGDSVLATFDRERRYTIHWTDDIVTGSYRITGARTDDHGRPWSLEVKDVAGNRHILNWDKIASVEEEPLTSLQEAVNTRSPQSWSDSQRRGADSES